MQALVKDGKDRLPLHSAVVDGNLEKVRLLLTSVYATGTDWEWNGMLDEPDYLRKSALLLAIQHNRDEIARELLDAGSCLDAKDKWSEKTVIHTAAETPGIPRIMSLLIKKYRHSEQLRMAYYHYHECSLLDAKDEDGRTALHCAAVVEGCEDNIEALIEAGANVEAEMDRGGRHEDARTTPLYHAAQAGCTENVRVLLTKGQASSSSQYGFKISMKGGKSMMQVAKGAAIKRMLQDNLQAKLDAENDMLERYKEKLEKEKEEARQAAERKTEQQNKLFKYVVLPLVALAVGVSFVRGRKK